jgi:hypothetical protein
LSRWPVSRSILLVLVLVATACSSRAANRTDESYPPIKIRVLNQNFYDATIYLVWRSDRRRLGVVGGNTEQSFTSQWYGPEIQVELQLLAGSRVRGDRLGISPGDELIVEIPSNPERFRVYKR